MAQLQLSARDYAGARYALATEMLADGKVEEAVAQLEAFLTSLPTHPSAAAARDMLGRAYLSQRRFGEAAQQFQLIVDTAPSYRGANDDIRLTLGYALAASGRLAEAVPVLEAAVAAKPNDAAARDLLARVRGATSSAPLTNRPN
jgi:predicted Zn-dependent protease